MIIDNARVVRQFAGYGAFGLAVLEYPPGKDMFLYDEIKFLKPERDMLASQIETLNANIMSMDALDPSAAKVKAIVKSAQSALGAAMQKFIANQDEDKKDPFGFITLGRSDTNIANLKSAGKMYVAGMKVYVDKLTKLFEGLEMAQLKADAAAQALNPTVAPQPRPTARSSIQTVGSQALTGDSGIPLWWYLAGGGAGLVVLLTGGYLVFRKKKSSSMSGWARKYRRRSNRRGRK